MKHSSDEPHSSSSTSQKRLLDDSSHSMQRGIPENPCPAASKPPLLVTTNVSITRPISPTHSVHSINSTKSELPFSALPPHEEDDDTHSLMSYTPQRGRYEPELMGNLTQSSRWLGPRRPSTNFQKTSSASSSWWRQQRNTPSLPRDTAPFDMDSILKPLAEVAKQGYAQSKSQLDEVSRSHLHQGRVFFVLQVQRLLSCS
jgi:hypothetical protein